MAVIGCDGREAERFTIPDADAQDLQLRVGGGLEACQAPDVDYGRRLVAATVGVPAAAPVHHQVGERFGEQGGADVLLMVEHDELPHVSARAWGEVDRDPVAAAVVAEGDPAG